MSETRLCPFKKATRTEYAPAVVKHGETQTITEHELFEECAGPRCMAYKASAGTATAQAHAKPLVRCLMLERESGK